jgi:Fe-S-cluster containining protein
MDLPNRPLLKDAVRQAMLAAPALRAVEGVYAELQRRIDARRPVCAVSGRCCRFEEFGHRLYVTTLELALFLSHDGGAGLAQATIATGCPFQVGKLCTVHPRRPFGCRIFFCDPSAEAWQQAQYEQLHAELKRLHESHQIPYFYVEWREALRALQADEAGRGVSNHQSL